MNKHGIEIGDLVQVEFWAGANAFTGTVQYIPQDTGDSWHIEDVTGRIHAVQTYAQIIQIKPPSAERKETT